MKFRPSFVILSIATSAFLTQGCARSIEQAPPQMAAIPARLLAPPAQLPSFQRTTDPVTGKLTISGEQCLNSGAEIYDVAGGIRATLIDLQEAVKARDAAPAPKKKRHLF